MSFSNSEFYLKLGFSKQEDFDSIKLYFHSDEKSGLKSVNSRINVKIKRIAHFFKTGVWINFHSVGQALNQYRFQKEADSDSLETIESLFNKKISPKFTKKAYKAAAKETHLESLRNNGAFFFQFVKSPTTVGSLLPSSKKLAKAIVRDVPGPKTEGPPRQYLEVGPGTGVFTKELIKKLRKEDQLDLVEFDEELVKVLRKRFGHLKNVHIIQGDFTTFNPTKQYDYCISGLPLAIFKTDMVEKVYTVFNQVVRQGGKIAYFEYLAIPSIKKTFLPNEARENFKGVLKIKQDYYQSHQGSSQNVWTNVTPARVCRVTVK